MMSPIGTTRTFRDVRVVSAIKGDADIQGKAPEGRDDAKRASLRMLEPLWGDGLEAVSLDSR
jgi:hypothetical protein